MKDSTSERKHYDNKQSFCAFLSISEFYFNRLRLLLVIFIVELSISRVSVGIIAVAEG